MQFRYTNKDISQERRLYDLLAMIKERPGVLIGEPSLTRLSHFIDGYEYATMELTDYRLHFDKEFQAFIEQKYPNKKG